MLKTNRNCTSQCLPVSQHASIGQFWLFWKKNKKNGNVYKREQERQQMDSNASAKRVKCLCFKTSLRVEIKSELWHGWWKMAHKDDGRNGREIWINFEGKAIKLSLLCFHKYSVSAGQFIRRVLLVACFGYFSVFLVGLESIKAALLTRFWIGKTNLSYEGEKVKNNTRFPLNGG